MYSNQRINSLTSVTNSYFIWSIDSYLVQFLLVIRLKKKKKKLLQTSFGSETQNVGHADFLSSCHLAVAFSILLSLFSLPIFELLLFHAAR